MNQLPALAYLHPIWQAGTLVFGLYIAARALPHIGDINFGARRHERQGRLFLVLVLAGVIFGKFVSASLSAGTFSIPGHSFLALLIVGLVIAGAIFGYQGGRLRLRVRTGMMQLHPWLIVLALALMLAQALMGIGNRGLRLIRF
ncbi:MAG: hypothetical protein ABIK62_01510 [candidate division WOR-3 bacterium]